jgi:hypothetical protein
VEVRSDRRWPFAIGAGELWSAISAVDRYRAWWPWLRGFEASGLHTGDEWRCVVQPPLPYTLRFTVTLDVVQPHRFVTATVGGDIRGSARLDIVERDDGGCDARMTSSLAPANRVLQAVAVVARPMARFGHDWVLDTGARQFRRQLAREP